MVLPRHCASRHNFRVPAGTDSMPPLMGHNYRSVCFGVETLPDHHVQRPRHRHAAGYATVVLAGNFIESGFAGRLVARAGDVLLHGRFDCHADAPQGVRPIQILRLPWDDDSRDGHFVTRDPDRLAQLAEGDPYEAMHTLARELRAVERREQHWTDALAARLASPAKLSLRHWATDRGLRPEELSRGLSLHVRHIAEALPARGARPTRLGCRDHVLPRAHGHCSGLRVRRSGAHEPQYPCPHGPFANVLAQPAPG